MKSEKQAQPMITAEGLTRIYSLGDTDVIGINQIDLKVYAGELMVWLSQRTREPETVVLVHGEYTVQKEFADRLAKELGSAHPGTTFRCRSRSEYDCAHPTHPVPAGSCGDGVSII